MCSDVSTCQIGARNELLAAAWLISQGYEVFRNVSPAGPVDIVGMKDGCISLFDVKSATLRSDGAIQLLKLSQEQKKLGVKIIGVFEDGSCVIEHAPRFKNESVEVVCAGCSKPFIRQPGQKRTFCTDKCGWNTYRAKKRAARLEGQHDLQSL